MNARTNKLRELAIALAATKDPNDRTVLVTESYQRTEGQPPILRRARALEHVLLHEPIVIHDGELIVGLQQQIAHCHRGVDDHLAWANAVSYPEWKGWFGQDYKEFTPAARQALAYWRNQPNVWRGWRAALAPEILRAMNVGVIFGAGFLQGHCIPDFAWVLNKGLNSIIAQAEGREGVFWEAILIVCRAAIRYAERHAELAEILAERTSDEARRRELQTIASICRRIPAQPATTFHEALQCVWLIHRIQENEMGDPGGFANSFGRLDQYLFPFYQRDVQSGQLTREQARELLECFYIKVHRTYNDQYIMLGGQKSDGSDATNELSFLCLEVMADVKLPLAIGVRVHRNTPNDFLKKATEVVKLGMGRPNFYNDEVTIPALTAKGITLEDARDYAVVGCVEVTIPGKGPFRTMAGLINLTKCLELALNGGRCMLTGEQVGPPVAADFRSFDELRVAYRQQVSYFTRLMVESMTMGEKIQAEAFPHPFLSALTQGCIQSGRDVTEGGARYNHTCPNALEIANVANSLAAIKRMVFEEKRLSLQELTEALKNDFAAQEDLRQYLLNRCPKYGNDDDSVDSIAREEMAFWCDELAQYRNSWGLPYMPLLFAATPASLYQYGPRTAASADGRRARQPLTISASITHGTDRSGPTAALKSVAKLDYKRLAGGASLIIDLHPTAVAGTDHRLASLIRTYFDLGGMEIGINIVDEQTLRQAQQNPERFRTLSVRIFGYSALFVNLSRDVQEYVIAKTKHML